MSFLLDNTTGDVEVIVHKDSAIGDKSKEAYEAYTKSFIGGTPDESHLKLTGDPTRFVLRRMLPYEHKQRVRGKNMKLKGQRMEVSVNIAMDTVRAHLIDIRHPNGVVSTKAIQFKKEGDGLASKALVNMLDQAQVLMDLFYAITNVTKTAEAEADEQKKS